MRHVSLALVLAMFAITGCGGSNGMGAAAEAVVPAVAVPVVPAAVVPAARAAAAPAARAAAAAARTRTS